MVKPPGKPPARPGAGLLKKTARAAKAAAAGLAIAVATSAPVPAAELDVRLTPDNPLALTHPHEARDDVPAVLMSYQQAWIADQAQLKVCEKSRRTGFTWAEAADDVLIASSEGGSNVFYISATQDMAREYIEACAMWARAFDYVASEISEGLYDDGDESGTVDPAKRYIKTYEVNFPTTGRRIVALSSRPTNLRGKQGVIVIDEAAFAPDLAALLKAAMAMLLWGDKVRIISTHDGAENPFNELIQEIRAGKRGPVTEASVHRVTFRQAVADGLYRRVCMRRGIDWTAEGEQKWVDQAYRFYGDDAAEELDAVPSQSAGAYLPLTLIAARMVPVATMPAETGPVIVRGKWDDNFAWLSDEVRTAAIEAWCQEELAPWIARLSPAERHAFGMDFARNRNLSVIVVGAQAHDLVIRPKITIELFNCPFACQRQIEWWLIDQLKLRRWRGCAVDAGGNGAALAEETAQRYGTQMVEQVMLNDPFYLAHMPKLKAALEDATLVDLPRDAQHQDDLRALKLINGIAKLPRGDTSTSAAAKAAAAEGGEKLKRHGDFAIALFLLVYAFQREAGEVDWMGAPAKHDRWDAGGGDGGEGRRMRMRAGSDERDIQSWRKGGV